MNGRRAAAFPLQSLGIIPPPNGSKVKHSPHVNFQSPIHAARCLAVTRGCSFSRSERIAGQTEVDPWRICGEVRLQGTNHRQRGAHNLEGLARSIVNWEIRGSMTEADTASVTPGARAVNLGPILPGRSGA